MVVNLSFSIQKFDNKYYKSNFDIQTPKIRAIYIIQVQNIYIQTIISIRDMNPIDRLINRYAYEGEDPNEQIRTKVDQQSAYIGIVGATGRRGNINQQYSQSHSTSNHIDYDDTYTSMKGLRRLKSNEVSSQPSQLIKPNSIQTIEPVIQSYQPNPNQPISIESQTKLKSQKKKKNNASKSQNKLKQVKESIPMNHPLYHLIPITVLPIIEARKKYPNNYNGQKGNQNYQSSQNTINNIGHKPQNNSNLKGESMVNRYQSQQICSQIVNSSLNKQQDQSNPTNYSARNWQNTHTQSQYSNERSYNHSSQNSQPNCQYSQQTNTKSHSISTNKPNLSYTSNSKSMNKSNSYKSYPNKLQPIQLNNKTPFNPNDKVPLQMRMMIAQKMGIPIWLVKDEWGIQGEHVIDSFRMSYVNLQMKGQLDDGSTRNNQLKYNNQTTLNSQRKQIHQANIGIDSSLALNYNSSINETTKEQGSMNNRFTQINHHIGSTSHPPLPSFAQPLSNPKPPPISQTPQSPNILPSLSQLKHLYLSSQHYRLSQRNNPQIITEIGRFCQQFGLKSVDSLGRLKVEREIDRVKRFIVLGVIK